MASLILPRRFTQQPQYPVEIDRGHPLAKNLVSAVSLNNQNDAVKNTLWTPTNVTKEPNNGSIHLKSVGGSNSALTSPTTYIPATTKAFTVVHDLYVNGLANWRSLWSINKDNYQTAFTQLTSTGVGDFIVASNAASYAGLVASGVYYRQLAWRAIEVTGLLVERSVIRNGQLFGSTGSCTLASATSAVYPQIFHANNLASRSCDGSMSYWYLFDRYLSLDELAELHENPWQLFRAKPSILYFDVSTGGGAQTLTPSLVTNSQTFYAPSVSAGSVTLTPTLVTNSQTFHAATVSVGAVDLTPSLVTNSQTFHAAVVTQEGGVQYLQPTLVTNSQTFHSATVAPGSVDILPTLLTNSQSWYAPVISQDGLTLVPELVTNSQTFPSATITTGSVSLLPPLLTNGQIFFGATVYDPSSVSPLYPITRRTLAAAPRVTTITASQRQYRINA